MPTSPLADARDDILLHVCATIETAAELSDRELLESGMASIGVAWLASEILGRAAARIERRVLRRTAQRLESDGLLIQIAAGVGPRITHLRPTPAGLAEAVRLAQGHADTAAIQQSLERIAWGAELADTLETCSPSSSQKDPAP